MADSKQPRSQSEEPAGGVGAVGLIIGLAVVLVGARTGIDPLMLATVAATAGPPLTAAAIRGWVLSPATVARLQAAMPDNGDSVPAEISGTPRRDPGWLAAWWPLWLAVVGLGFVGPEAVALVSELRHLGVAVEMDLAGRSLKGQFKQADRVGAAHTLILEAGGSASLRNMESGDQQTVDPKNVVSLIRP